MDHTLLEVAALAFWLRAAQLDYRHHCDPYCEPLNLTVIELLLDA